MFAFLWRACARRATPTRRRARPNFPRPDRALPAVELLEDRTLLSNSIPLSSTAWAAIGPAPLQNGQDPGSQPVSGRVTDIAVDPTGPANTYYVAAAGGGVWKTSDAGATWTPLTDDQASLNMGALAVTHNGASTIIYAATGEANLGPSKTALNRDNIYYGEGILFFNGSSWAQELGPANAFNRVSFSRVVIDPTDTTGMTAYAAVGATADNGLGGNKGVWKTIDGGAHWANTTDPGKGSGAGIAGSLTTAFSDLVIDPANPNVLLAAVGEPGGSGVNGIYKTSDGGLNWAKLAGAPDGSTDPRVGRITLAIAKTNDNRLYAAVAESGASGFTAGALREMVTSTNGGTSWSLLPQTPNYLGSAGDYDTALAVDPTTELVVYAAGQGDVIKTTNAGGNWSNIDVGVDGRGPHGDHHALTFDQNTRLLDGNDGGIWRLNNASLGSLAWGDLNTNLATLQVTGVAQQSDDPNNAYAGSQDNGTERFADSTTWNEVQGGDGGFVRVAPGTGGATVYHTFFYPQPPNNAIGFLERSTNHGNTWTPITSGIHTSSDRANFYPPYVIDPSNAARLVLGTDHVYETTNSGNSWAIIGGPGSPGWTTTAVVDAVAVVPGNANVVYASAGGQVFATLNHGLTWTATSPVAGPPAGLRLRDLLVDPSVSSGLTAYVVAGNFSDVTGGGHVWRTTNGGTTWTAIDSVANGFPDVPAWSLALDPNEPNTTGGALYVGTDLGVYTTNDPADASPVWTRLGGAGLPNAQVHNLDLSTTTHVLAAATNGRGVWEFYNRLVDLNWVPGGSVTPTVTATDTDTTFQINYTYRVDQGPVPDNFTVAFYASKSGVFPAPATDPSDTIFLGSQLLTSAADKAVGVNSETSPLLRIGRAGTYHLIAVLDPYDNLTETDEASKANDVFITTATITIAQGSGLKGDGLLAEYYPNMSYGGPAAVRTDANVNFNWAFGKYALDPTFGKNNWGARWVGQVMPQFSETYTFSTLSDDGVRLYVGGQLLINDFTTHAPTEDSGSITLLAGHKYDLWMDYFQNADGATATLSWSSPSTPKQVIPQDDLFSSRSTAPLTLVAPYNGDNRPDLWVFVPSGTPSGQVELRIFSAASIYVNTLLSTPLPLPAVGPATFLSTFAFDVGDFNHDGKNDLWVIIKNNTGSGKTEVHVLDGANNFQTFLLHTATALPQLDNTWSFQVVDYNHDGTLDVAAFGTGATGSGKTEVHVLDGATNFATFLLHTATALPALGGTAGAFFRLGSYNGDNALDLYFVAKNGTGSGMTEVHVLSQASGYQAFVGHVATALGPTFAEANFGLSDYDGNGSLDLVYLARFNTGSDRIEVHVLSGSTNFQTFLAHLASRHPASGVTGQLGHVGQGPLSSGGLAVSSGAAPQSDSIGAPLFDGLSGDVVRALLADRKHS